MFIKFAALFVVCMMVSPFPVCQEAADQTPAVQAVELHAVVQVVRGGARQDDADDAPGSRYCEECSSAGSVSSVTLSPLPASSDSASSS